MKRADEDEVEPVQCSAVQAAGRLIQTAKNMTADEVRETV